MIVLRTLYGLRFLPAFKASSHFDAGLHNRKYEVTSMRFCSPVHCSGAARWEFMAGGEPIQGVRYTQSSAVLRVRDAKGLRRMTKPLTLGRETT